MEAAEPYFPVVLTRLYKMVLVLSLAEMFKYGHSKQSC